MLPDYVEAKKILLKMLNERMFVIANKYRNPLGITGQTAFEGHSFLTESHSGFRDESRAEEISGKFQISKEDLECGNPNVIFEKIDKAAAEMGDQQYAKLFTKMAEVTSKTGRVKDFGGMPFTFDAFLETLEMIDIEFDESGKAHNLAFVIPPNLSERVSTVMQEALNDPDLKRKHDELMERKRQEWRDREANRQLVG